MNEFLEMGGYAFYVWSSYGISLIILLINVYLPLQREKKIIQSITEKNKQAK